MNITKKKLLIGCLIIALCIAAGGLAFPLFLHVGEAGGQAANGSGNLPGRAKGRVPDEIVALSISCVGDVMVHQPQIPAQYDSSTGQYNFDNNFQYIKEYIEQVDLALCNVETTLRGKPYTGYPTFSSPETLAEALKIAGFDVAITANNHMMDTGYTGMQKTLTVLREAGLVTVGSQLTQIPATDSLDSPPAAEKEYALVEINGVNVAVVAYTYATGEAGRILVNGSRIAAEAEPLINYFRYSHLEEDLEKVAANIQDARQDGADLVIVYYHWGEEYQRSPNDWQLLIARETAEMGADMIFASHPHVLQGMELLEVETAERAPMAADAMDQQAVADAAGYQEVAAPTVRQVPVFYSMGNFLSNQRVETLDNRYTEQGMIANVHLEYNKTRGEVVSVAMDAIPTWVNRQRSGSNYAYTIIPLTGDFENNPVLRQSGNVSRAQQALADVQKLLGEEYVK